MAYNFAAIRQLVEKALTRTELENLLSDHFRSLFNDIEGESLPNLRRKLVEYAEKHREIPQLLAEIRNCNPTVYAEFESQLGIPVQPEARVTPPIQKCDVLVLAANPLGTDLLQLEQEATLIQQRLQEGETGRDFIVKVEQAVRAEDFSRFLLQYEPLIIHFSGHGDRDGNIILNNDRGEIQAVSPEDLAELLAIVRGRVECVILNACFSLEKADALAEQVSCVMGMDAAIDDESAVRFTAGFYRGLGFGWSYYRAFELGRNEINLLQLPDGEVPHFITRNTSLISVEAAKPRVTRTFSTQQQTEATLYPLWFGTNRKPNNPQDLAKGFSGERDNKMHYGTCQVTVPKSHEIGSVGSPWWKFVLTDDRLKLDRESLKLFEETSFLAAIQKALQDPELELDERSALVFIHGFNVSFEDAALRAAQIGVDLKQKGLMAFYSWPSKGKLLGYSADEDTIGASEQYITEFLLNLVQKSGVNKVHIIAHSMGNRGLLRAMQRISANVQTEAGIKFGQIFLAAPDVDPDLFQELAKAYQQLSERTTLYVSAKDKALATSGILHDYPRVGFFPPITVVDGIDTVEVSDIDLTFLGHGYFAEADDLLQDIYNLLRYNASPDNRFGLQAVEVGMQKYWRIAR
jgi:esterase/lipase superfamily enzyme